MKNGTQAQAVIKVVPRGGAKNPAQIKRQWDYLSRKGEIKIKRSEHHQAVLLAPDTLADTAEAWALQTGNWIPDKERQDQDLTTHIVVSFPPGTHTENAEKAARAWAHDMFGGNHDHDQYDYISMFHTDKDHPHMHFVVNRRGMGGDWLKISKRDPVMNYDNMRQRLVIAADKNDIELDATRREERGLDGKSLTDAQYRELGRMEVFVYPKRQPDPDSDYHDYRETYGDLPKDLAREYGADNNGDAAQDQAAAQAQAPVADHNGAGPSNQNAAPEFEHDDSAPDDQDSDDAFDPAAAGPSRPKRGRTEPNQHRAMTLQNANPKRARIGDAPEVPQDEHIAAPSKKRSREDITLRSDTNAQAARDNEASLHLRSGKRIKKSGPDDGRSDDHSR